MSWDETYSRDQNGVIAFNYIINDDSYTYQNSDERYHGTAIELPLYALEKTIGITDVRAIYLFLHYMNYLLFLLSAFFFYKLIRTIYDDWWIAFVGLIIYVFTPRIFADAFYNSKDVAFLSIFTIAMYTGFKFLEKQNIKTILFHAMLCGFLVAIRISGVILPAITLGIYFLQQVFKMNKSSWKYFSIIFISLMGISFLTTILFWPILWFGPINEFKNAWVQISHFHWGKDVLYLGDFISDVNIPWHYIPVWIGLTTPIITLVLCLTGLCILIIEIVKNAKRKFNMQLHANIVFALYLILPVAAIVGLHSVVYDGWRHVFFLHAPMVALLCFAINKIAQNKNQIFKKLFLVLIAVFYFPLFLTMAQLHPYENLYFNKLKYSNVGDARFKMDLDYWGLSYRKALEYIIKTDKRPLIHIKVDTYPGKLNAVLLPYNDRNRIVFEDEITSADYFIGNYRWMKNEYPYKNEIYSLSVDGAKIMVCFKLK